MEGTEAADLEGGEEWACEGVEGGVRDGSSGTIFCLRVGERGSVRRAITWR